MFSGRTKALSITCKEESAASIPKGAAAAVYGKIVELADGEQDASIVTEVSLKGEAVCSGDPSATTA